MGGLTPMPVQSALEHFPEDFGAWDSGGAPMTMDNPLSEPGDYGTPAVRRRDPRTSPSTASRSTVPAGTSVMRAATEAGVDVPKLCATDSLKAFGSCRMCLVEVDGIKGMPASCTTPCTDGMVV